ncbi:MAG: hypothetical protein J6T34_01245 [Bacilli bacterium]|nr:hypothetical protein [Bacilli bacterium]
MKATIKENLQEAFILTFSKKWVNRLMWVAIIDLQLSYVLAFLDKVEIAQQLSIAIVTEIISVMLGYFAKAFLGKREEENLKYKKEQETEYYLLDDDDPVYPDVNEEEAQG